MPSCPPQQGPRSWSSIPPADAQVVRLALPILKRSLEHPKRPDQIVTVFASTDREATARAREYFTNQPPSSPSFALMKEGKLVQMIQRSQIEGHSVEQVVRELTEAYDKHC